MPLSSSDVSAIFGMCRTCHADPCTCPTAPVKSPSLSSMVGAQHPSGGSIPNHMTISSGSITGSSISSVTIEDLARRRINTTVTEPKPEPKPFVPSWEKDEEEIELDEDLEMFKLKSAPEITTMKDNPSQQASAGDPLKDENALNTAVATIRAALAKEVHGAILDGNTELVNMLMNMTSTDLLDYYS